MPGGKILYGTVRPNGERPGGAKSTRTARHWRIARMIGPLGTRGEAQAEERRVKWLARAERLPLGEAVEPNGGG